MHYHANAALTATQRRLVRQLHQDGTSQIDLARRFGVHRRTIQRWISREDTADRSCAPKQHGRQTVTDAYRQTGVYVARVLNGEKPGELPVIQAVKFEFILNLKTARALGIDVPMAFSATADEIIE